MKYLLIALLILSSCTTAKRCAKRFPQVASVDSVYVETLKEVPIYLPGDSIEIEIPIDCPDQDVTVETGRLKQQITILNKMLKSKTTIKPDTVKVYVTETEVQYKEVKIPQVIKETPRFWKITGWIGIASVLTAGLLFVLKIRSIPKKILSLFK